MNFILEKLRSVFGKKSVGGIVETPVEFKVSSSVWPDGTFTLADVTKEAVTNIVIANIKLAEVISKLKEAELLPENATFYIHPRKCATSVVGYCITELLSDKCIYCRGKQ